MSKCFFFFWLLIFSDVFGKMTAPVWQRGIMEEHYDLPQSSMQWFTGAVEPSATERKEKIKLDLPSNLSVTPIGPGKCLSQVKLLLHLFIEAY